MECLIRTETPEDFAKVTEVLQSAFYRDDYDPEFNEWMLVESIRSSLFYLPELALVAAYNCLIVGHIMLTPMWIIDCNGVKYGSLALAPLAVHKDYQRQGIGTKLVQAAVNLAKDAGFKSIIVLGDPNYYQRFGFQPAANWKIALEDEYNSHLMALELVEGSLNGISGNVKYCPPFYSAAGELI